MIRYIKEFYRFLKHIIHARELLITLIKNDFKKRYLGSYLGLLWAFIQPLTYMFVIWFVFQVGFRSGSVDEVPLFLWLITGMIPWFYFSTTLVQGTGSIVENAFLVKKISFRVSILPLVQIGSLLLIHLPLILFLIGSYLLYGYTPNLYWLQLPYYIASSIFLLLGLTWLTSAIRVFVKDISNLMGVILQFGFWFTPIFWQIDKIPQQYQWLLKINPVYYIVEGYRDTFINHIWFWEHTRSTPYFITLTTIFLIIGAITFKKLRPHFGDVL